VNLSAANDAQEIQFLWTMYPQKTFISAMASEQQGLRVVLNDEKRLQMKPAQNPCSQPVSMRAHNHFSGGSVITSKAGLVKTIVDFYLRHGRDPFGAVPLTFVVTEGSSDPQFAEWRRAYDLIEQSTNQSMWLVKPGDLSNRGNGIRIYDSSEGVAERVDSKSRAWVLQKYMEAPLLVHKRKFDIRAYCLVTQEPNGGGIHAFFYREAYLRTTSVEYSIKSKDLLVHLNNDAVQKTGDDYGKFESANKLSLVDFQRYLDEHLPKKRYSVQEALIPQMKSLVADTIRAAGAKLNPKEVNNCFEVFGFDFMVDASFRVWLIEVNSNPCLELCNSYLSYLIPKMLDEALQVTLDRVFPPQGTGSATKDRTGSGAARTDISSAVSGTGWEPVFCSSGPNADIVSCAWVPELLVQDDGSSPDLASLGRDLLMPVAPSGSTGGGAKTRRSSTSKKAASEKKDRS